MNGIDWAALPVVAEIIGCDDPETLITQLVTIRDWQRDNPPETD